MNELELPPSIKCEETAFEIIRICILKNAPQVVLATGVWDDPAAWGILLVDIARHISHTYTHTHNKDYTEALDRIKEGFDAEWDSSTDEPMGTIEK